MNTTENQKWQLDLLRELIRTSFKLRYNDSVLGFYMGDPQTSTNFYSAVYCILQLQI
ncbi:hypothetical protein H6762_05020 [Candidatus Nomurabacteria bacterium]|nr:hypothetical protein [Candidatus Nomurabacteria bacterium]